MEDGAGLKSVLLKGAIPVHAFHTSCLLLALDKGTIVCKADNAHRNGKDLLHQRQGLTTAETAKSMDVRCYALL